MSKITRPWHHSCYVDMGYIDAYHVWWDKIEISRSYKAKFKNQNKTIKKLNIFKRSMKFFIKRCNFIIQNSKLTLIYKCCSFLLFWTGLHQWQGTNILSDFISISVTPLVSTLAFPALSTCKNNQLDNRNFTCLSH